MGLRKVTRLHCTTVLRTVTLCYEYLHTLLSHQVALAVDTLSIEDTLILSLAVVGVVVTHTLVVVSHVGGRHVYTPATGTGRGCTVILWKNRTRFQCYSHLYSLANSVNFEAT